MSSDLLKEWEEQFGPAARWSEHRPGEYVWYMDEEGDVCIGLVAYIFTRRLQQGEDALWYIVRPLHGHWLFEIIRAANLLQVKRLGG